MYLLNEIVYLFLFVKTLTVLKFNFRKGRLKNKILHIFCGLLLKPRQEIQKIRHQNQTRIIQIYCNKTMIYHSHFLKI